MIVNAMLTEMMATTCRVVVSMVFLAPVARRRVGVGWFLEGQPQTSYPDAGRNASGISELWRDQTTMIFAGDVFAGEDDADRVFQFRGVSLDEGQGDRARRLDHQRLCLEQLSQRRADVRLRYQRDCDAGLRDGLLNHRVRL